MSIETNKLVNLGDAKVLYDDLRGRTESVAASIAPDYGDLTFPVSTGRLCYHSGVLYKANQDISTSEDWTAAHWTVATVDELNTALKQAINQKYSLPSGGIPSTDLASGVQTSLGLADTAYQKPSGGIPASDIADGVVTTVETISGSTPSITASANHRYICGECATLSFTPSATGVCDVVFTSGSTPTVLTVPNTVKFPDAFDPSSLDANTVYEINILNGVYGLVSAWA